MAELFDFGFTAVTEDELEVVQKSQAKAAEVGSEAARAAETATKTQERLDSLFNAIQPLLTNLKAMSSNLLSMILKMMTLGKF